MGVLANIIIALTAKTDGLEKGVKRSRGFVDQLSTAFTHKLIGAVAVLHAIDRGANGLADAMEKARDEGESFNEALTNSVAGFAESIPVIGGLVRVFAFAIDEATGLNTQLREMNDRLDEANDKIAKNEVRARKAAQIHDVLAKLEGDVKYHGMAPELRTLMENNGTAAAIARVKELIAQRGQLLAADRRPDFPLERRFVGTGGRVPGGVQNSIVTIHSRQTVIMPGTISAQPVNGGGAW